MSYPISQSAKGRGSLDLVFDGKTEFDRRITFTRASTGSYFNSLGLMQQAVSNEPRIDYDPVTGFCKGLLIEEVRTNLLLRSEDFDNAAWVKINATSSPNAVASPDGTVTGDKLIEDVTNSGHYLQQFTTTVTATAYTGTVFIRAGERTKVDVLVYRGATFGGCSVDLSVGTKSTPQTAAVTDLSASAVVTALPSGFYRVSIPFTSDDTSGGIRVSLSNGASTVYTGDGTSGLYIWGAQLEQGAFATSYIPTVASQVTRAAEVVSMTGTSFSSWYRQEEGSFVAGFSSRSPSTTNAAVLSANDGASAINTVDIIHQTDEQAIFRLRAASATVFSGIGFSFTDGATSKFCIAYKSGSNAWTKDGAAASSNSTSWTQSAALTTLHIGCNQIGTQQVNGHISRLTFYPTRLTNTQLQELSV